MSEFDDLNPLTRWLDQIGLPWRCTRAQLMARYPLATDNPYEWPIVSIDCAEPPLAGMLWPLGFQCFGNLPTALPPLMFSTAIWLEDDARVNVRNAARELAPILGPQAATDRFNTMSAEWRFGRASLRLTGWPADLQNWDLGPNPAHEREPRLRPACHVEIDSGWRLQLSPQDRLWLDDAALQNCFIDPPPSARIPPLFGAEHALPYLRAISVDSLGMRGRMAVTKGRDALLFGNAELHIVPVRDIVQLECRRLLPAKGGGGSSLTLQCGGGTDDSPFQWLQLLQADRADDLTQFGNELATVLGVPLEIGKYVYDC